MKYTLKQLKDICKLHGIKGYSNLKKYELLQLCSGPIKLKNILTNKVLESSISDIIINYKRELEITNKHIKSNIKKSKYLRDIFNNIPPFVYFKLEDLKCGYKLIYYIDAIKRGIEDNIIIQIKNPQCKNLYKGHYYKIIFDIQN